MIRKSELGGISIPMLSALGTVQTYQPAVRETILAMGDGTLDKQTLAGTEGKVSTSISADGTVPPGLTGLAFEDNLLLKCGAPRDIVSISNIITIPNLRRSDTDYEPWGRAFVNDEVKLTTVDNIAGDVVTLVAVAGASAYQVMWYPEFQVYVTGGISITYNEFTGMTQWQLEMRQV